jgi:hypothetical protein
MTPETTPPPNQPTVTSIHVHYMDGSSDDIRLLQRDELPIYDLRRSGPGAATRSLGAHTYGAIAAILLHTVTTTERVQQQAELLPDSNLRQSSPGDAPIQLAEPSGLACCS